MFSMTGMGQAKAKIFGSQFTVDIKSVNHRYCDVSVRLPHRYSLFEIPLITLVKEKIQRGKVDVMVYEEKGVEKLEGNSESIKDYFLFLKKLQKQFKMTEPIGIAHLQAGSQFWMRDSSDARKDWVPLKKVVVQALDSLLDMRKREGNNLKTNLQSRLKTLRVLQSQAEERRETVLLSYKQKLTARISKLLETDVDQARLAQEVAFLADRADITEELERLKSHFTQMEVLLNAKDPVGRQMDFLIQEFNREWNTIGSKSPDAIIAQSVVMAKTEIEKIREQVQNIE